MRAITGLIVCGGRGARLGPLGDVVNKCVLPVDGLPAVVHVVKTAIESFGVQRCLLLTGHLGEQVEHVVRAYSPQAELTFVPDEDSCGTARAVQRAVSTYDIGDMLYAHANVALGLSAAEALRREHRIRPSVWAVSTAPIAPTHPRLRAHDSVLASADPNGRYFSVGFGVLEADVLRAAGSRDASRGQTLEDWVFGATLNGTVAATDIGGAWSHVEDLTSYRSTTTNGTRSSPLRVA